LSLGANCQKTKDGALQTLFENAHLTHNYGWDDEQQNSREVYRRRGYSYFAFLERPKSENDADAH
jgi:hypothetical protein